MIKEKINIVGVGLRLILILAMVICLFPMAWLCGTSLKTIQGLFMSPWGLPTRPLQWQNYLYAWVKTGKYFLNSGIITGCSVLAMVLFGSMAAYSICRYTPRWSYFLLFFFLIGQMIPGQAVLVSVGLLLVNMNLLDTWTGLILVYIGAGLPFTIFILQGFFRNIPKEIFDAAVIDGCGEFGILWRIVLPLSKPGLASIGIFQSLWIWNEFPLALVILRREAHRTLTLGIFRIIEAQQTNITTGFAALFLSIIPVIALYLILQRHFITGLTSGAVK